MSADKIDWHLDKRVAIGSILTLVGLLFGQVYQYGVLNEKVSAMEATINSVQDTKVTKDVVEQMFITRDMQIIELKDDVKENQRLLREILKELPKQ